ncbi:hypothetical protein ACHAXT_002230 [Thalassiosira profunda]
MTIVSALALNLALAASVLGTADAASIRGGRKLAPVLKGQRHLSSCSSVTKNKDCNAPCVVLKGSCTDGTPAPTKAPTPNPTTAEPTTAMPTNEPTNPPTAPPTSPPTPPPTLFPTEPPTPSSTPAPTTPFPTEPLTPSPTDSLVAMTCPEEHCANQAVNSVAVGNSTIVCPNLSATVLATYEYDGVALIELTGPANLADALDLVITAPHGGTFEPAYIDDRAEDDATYCPSSGCKVLPDTNTNEIAELLQQKMIENYCKVPFLVKNNLRRSKLDANREVGEAAHGNATAIEAWTAFHTFINYAQGNVSDAFGTTTANSITGINGLLFDVHGYSGKDWVPDDGSPLIQWGYRLSDDESLNTTAWCPIDDKSTGSFGTLTHGRWMNGQSYECLVRGPGSLGSRVAALIDANNLPTEIGDAAMCGHGTPSFEYPSPVHLATDTTPIAQGGHCDRYANGGKECHYYSGGYDVKVHERIGWEDEDNLYGDHMNTVQAELPRCIRWADSDQVREDFAHLLSQAMYGFLRDLYGPI